LGGDERLGENGQRGEQQAADKTSDGGGAHARVTLRHAPASHQT
jgi:hypothetical protein